MTATMQFWGQFGPMVAGGVLALVADMLDRRKLAAWVAALGLLVGGAVGLYGGWTMQSASAFDTFFVGAAFSTIPGVVGLLSALTLLASVGVLGRKSQGGSLAALIAFAACAAALTACATDLVALLLAIETAALASYAFVASARTRRGDESSIKYYIQGAVSTGVLVLGIAVLVALYAPDGSYVSLAGALGGLTPATGTPALLGVLLMVTAFAFKSGAAPFHSWAPDAYENAPAETAAFMAGPLKLAFLFAGMILIVTTGLIGRSDTALLGVLGGDVFPIVGFLGALSVIAGSIVALRQSSYARMLGYAGVAQVGYAFIAISSLSSIAVSVFATTYAVAATGAFLAILAFESIRPGWDGSIRGLAGLGRRVPALGVALTLLMMSLAGLPPLLGFWGKFEVFVAAIGAAQQLSAAGSDALGVFYAALALIGVAGSIVSVAYYGRVVRVLFSEEPAPETDVPRSARMAVTIVVVIAVLVLVTGLAPLVLGISSPLQGFLLSQ